MYEAPSCIAVMVGAHALGLLAPCGVGVTEDMGLARTEMSRAEFDAAEAIVERGQRAFVEVGQALMTIREGHGYRHAGFGTFEEYIAERWGWARRHGYNLMAAAAVTSNVQSIAQTFPTLTQAIDLATLPPAEQREFIQDLPKPLNEYTTRALRREIQERRSQRVRDARRNLLDSMPAEPPVFNQCHVYQSDAAHIHRADLVSYRDVDLIVTSPPYGIGLEGSDLESDLDWSRYLATARAWAYAMHEVAHPAHGRLCLNVPLDRTKGSREPVYADWVKVLRTVGWRYESTIIWKENNVSNHQARGSVASPNAPHAVAPVETILVMYRGEWNRNEAYRPTDIREIDWIDWLSTTWQFAGEHRYRVGHMAPFPEELPRRLIQLFSFPGDLIADPFVGSGTTAVVAWKLGRRFVGSDIDPECVALAQARVSREIAA